MGKRYLTEEEKQSLELQRAEAKARCRETWETLQTLRKLLKSYERIYTRWYFKFEEADRKLAEVEKKRVIPKGCKKESIEDGIHLLDKLSKDQLAKVLQKLNDQDN